MGDVRCDGSERKIFFSQKEFFLEFFLVATKTKTIERFVKGRSLDRIRFETDFETD